jgi:hypothetical protein
MAGRGPDVSNPPAGALVVPATGGDLWARVTDTPEVDAALVDRISLLDAMNAASCARSARSGPSAGCAQPLPTLGSSRRSCFL